MNDMFFLKDDTYGPVYIRSAAVGAVRIVPAPLREQSGGDVEIRYLSGTRDFITLADWERIKPMLLATDDLERQTDETVQRLTEQLMAVQDQLVIAQDRIRDLEASTKPLPEAVLPAEITPPADTPSAPVDPKPVEAAVPVPTGEMVSIIRVEKSDFKSKTSNSRRPMWRLFTSDGRQTNAFDHADPLRDHKRLLEAADYLEIFVAMEAESEAHWQTTPIEAVIDADGQFWKLVALTKRHAEQIADLDGTLSPTKLAVCYEALAVMNDPATCVIDSETTGLEVDDEMIEIAVYTRISSPVPFTTRIKPHDMTKLRRVGKSGKCAVDIHGIDEAALENALSIAQTDLFYPLWDILHKGVWVGFNIGFDERLLNQSWAIGGAPSDRLPRPTKTVDVMDMMKRYTGRKFISLDDACKVLGIKRGKAHEADSDAWDTLQILNCLAEKAKADMPVAEPDLEAIPF